MPIIYYLLFIYDFLLLWRRIISSYILGGQGGDGVNTRETNLIIMRKQRRRNSDKIKNDESNERGGAGQVRTYVREIAYNIDSSAKHSRRRTTSEKQQEQQ